MLKFWIGEVIHEAVQKLMSEDPGAGVLGHEVPVKDEEHNVSGKADTFVQTGEDVVVDEYKTIDSNAFFHSNLPYESHIEQLAIYMAFQTEFKRPARGTIWYFGKQDGRMRDFDIENTPELTEYVKGHLKSLEAQYANYLKGEMPPPIHAPAIDSRIKNCEYRGSGLCCGDKKPVQPSLLGENDGAIGESLQSH